MDKQCMRSFAEKRDTNEIDSLRKELKAQKSEISELRSQIESQNQTSSGSQSDCFGMSDISENDVFWMTSKLPAELRERLNDVVFFESIFLNNSCTFISDIK